MIRFCISILCFSALFIQNTVCQNETCPACPPEGVWSAWQSNDICNTTCGACSMISRTRTCLSEPMGCPCVGETSATYPCNTQACIVAQVNSKTEQCCVGNATLYGNLYHCVAPPEPTKLACCPPGGYWTTWTAFVPTPGKTSWKRTRKCISDNTNCPCTGNDFEIKNECPCIAPTSLPADDMTCQNQADRKMTGFQNAAKIITTRPQIKVRPELCQAYAILETSTFQGKFVLDQSGKSNILFGNVDETGYCNVVRYDGPPLPLSSDGSTMRLTFNCNYTSLRYEGSQFTKGLNKVGQFIWP